MKRRSISVLSTCKRFLSGNIRQHVNPLSSSHQLPIQLCDDWVCQEYSHPDNPFIVDIGCSKGHWTADYAAAHSDKNVLGLDIRQPVIDLALRRKKSSSSSTFYNLHFMKSNANVDIGLLLRGIASSSSAGVELVAIQFPDPYFKARQHKRRLVNDDFIRDIATNVKTGTKLFVQTDVEELMAAMVDVLRRNSHLVSPVEGNDYSNLLHNPSFCDILTEREAACIENGNDDIYKITVHTL